ncbi:MAG: FtsK/SpoIIIE domain-containing protein [Clostridiaceae bacterium]
MYTEIALWGLGCYGYHRLKTKGEREIKKKWNKIMVGAGIKNKEDKARTFEIKHIETTRYGYLCKVSIPAGLNFKRIEELKPTIEDNLKCLCEVTKDRFSNYINIEIIINPLNNLKFTPVKTKPYELFLGYDFTGKPVVLNQNKFPHLLIAGTTGTGKSRLVFVMLTNLIHNHSNKEIELYLTQVRKRDLKHFRYCKQTKFYATTMEETNIMLERLCKIIERRENIIDKAGCENIEEYNKIARQKMKCFYICAEEFSFYMPDPSDTAREKEQKEKALSYLKNIILTGRAVGGFVITSLQRTTVDNIPATLKSQMARVTFRQMSDINSINAIESTGAVGLENQEAILFTNTHTKFKTVEINKYIIKESIKDSSKDIVQEKVQDAGHSFNYSWKIPSLEEWKQIKDNIQLMNVPEKLEPIGQYNPPKKIFKKKGVVSLEEVRNNVNAKG